VAAAFRSDWDVAIDALQGVSAGVVRSLRAYADVDVAETLATIGDAGAQGPGRGAGLLLVWRRWHPLYVVAEIERQLPELVERWPTKAERHNRRARDRLRDRWVADAVRILETLEAAPMPVDALAAKLGMRPGRFARILTALREIGAIREERQGARMFVVAPTHWVREKMFSLSS